MSYAIIKVGGKQHRVREGEWLLVDRLPVDEGKTFQPEVLLVGGDGEARLGDELAGTQVTALVTEHVLGPKLVIGKHKKRTGYRRRNGFRARLSKIEIESIGSKRASRARKPSAEAAPAESAVAEKPKRTRRTTKKTDEE
jgi:large subunit ribosomal protein L21